MRYFAAVFVFLFGVIIHWMWSTYFSFFGLAPQLLLVLTVAAASCGGPVVGQCFGFAWGLCLDLLSAHVFGANALGLTFVGYFVGGLRRQMDVASSAPQFVLIGLLTPAYLIFYGLIGLLFEHHFLWAGWTVFLVVPFYNCLVIPFAFEFSRRLIDL